MSVPLHWSDYAVALAWRYPSGQSMTGYPAPTTYTARLYSDTANPDGGGTPTECTLGGYAAQVCPLALVSGQNKMTTTADVAFNGLSPGTVAGLAVTDDGTGKILYWYDFSPAIDTSLMGGVIVPAGQLSVYPQGT